MKKIIPLFIALSVSLSFSQDIEQEKDIPDLKDIEKVIGIDEGAKEFIEFTSKFRFSKSHLRKNSWGSSFGVFLECNKDGKVYVVMRPPSGANGMAAYKGALPKGLKSGNSLEEIISKLGKPAKVTKIGKPEDGYITLDYESMTVIVINKVLFEVWLHSK